MRKKEKGIIALLSLLILLISGTVYINLEKPTKILLDGENTEIIMELEATVLEEKEDNNITVYICGYVNKPGNVTVEEGERLGNALEYVGGLAEEADLNAINLAHKLYDEEMIYIPKKGETINEQSDYLNGNSEVYTGAKKININRATAYELESLPGIGSVTAKKIINYRKTNNGFNSIEELKNVPGIGEKKFESLAEYIIAK